MLDFIDRELALVAIREVLDGVTVTSHGEEVHDYAGCLVTVAQALDGTLPDGNHCVTWEPVSRARAERVFAEHRELVSELFDRACMGPIEL